jgi:hypothetical protein
MEIYMADNIKLRLSFDDVVCLIDMIDGRLLRNGAGWHHADYLKQLRDNIIEQTEKRGHQFDSA